MKFRHRRRWVAFYNEYMDISWIPDRKWQTFAWEKKPHMYFTQAEVGRNLIVWIWHVSVQAGLSRNPFFGKKRCGIKWWIRNRTHFVWWCEFCPSRFDQMCFVILCYRGFRLQGHHCVTIFVTRLEIITETLMTRLINGNASQYVAAIKTTEALL